MAGPRIEPAVQRVLCRAFGPLAAAAGAVRGLCDLAEELAVRGRAGTPVALLARAARGGGGAGTADRSSAASRLGGAGRRGRGAPASDLECQSETTVPGAGG